jgi:hypothetical protein
MANTTVLPENLHESVEIWLLDPSKIVGGCGPDFLEIHHDFLRDTWASLTRPSAEEHYKYVGYILAGLSGYIFMHDHGPLGAGETYELGIALLGQTWQDVPTNMFRVAIV